MSAPCSSVPCYGKINLFLEVQDKRTDGFHNLGTLFQAVSCHDTLSAEPWDRIELVCPTGITALPEQNLVYKAAALLKEKYSNRLKADSGIRFHLEKKLPSGAGLGGGSSDAAGALSLANRIWDLNLSETELNALAAQLGSDVPFFLRGGGAFAEGRGEILSPAPDPFPFHVVIGTPRCEVATGWAYGQLDAQRKQEWKRFKALYFTYFEDPNFYQVLRNDFDAPIRRHFPEIQALSDSMREFGPTKVLLSGSGASVFGLFTARANAEKCESAIRDQCRFSTVAEFVN